jgi:Tol biopolymer transport system component
VANTRSTTNRRRSRRRRVAVAGLVASQVAVGTAFAATAQAATTERVSISSAGQQGNDHSGGADASSDGSYIVFSSVATNLAGGITQGQVYVRDKIRGATELVSMGNLGLPNGRALAPSISDDGRFVAFQSFASNLVSGDTNAADDIFVKDRQTGTVTRVSVSSSGAQGSGVSSDPAISGDGRYVAFASSSSTLVGGDTNGTQDVFVHDTVTRTTTRASVGTTGVQGNSVSSNPVLSRDGSRVAFESAASNLIGGADTNQMVDIFVGSRSRVQLRASQSSAAVQGNSSSRNAALSGDGSAVVFDSRTTNLVDGDTNNRVDVFHHNLVTRQTTRVVNGAGSGLVNNPGNGDSLAPSTNHNGRLVAFSSKATNLVANDANGSVGDVFVANLDAARGAQNTLVSVTSGGAAANGVSSAPALSSNGQVVAFASAATNLAAGDTNGKTDAFARRP